MKPTLPAIVGTCAILSIGTTWADTIAYWRFEGDGVTTPTAGTQIEDSDGRTTTATGVGIRAIDSSGNGNTIWAWEHAWGGHTYEPGVPWSAVPQTGAANGFFAKNAGDYPALFTWSNQSSPAGTNIDTWTSLTWTIEASFYTTALGAYRTVVGREGNGVATANANAAPLYFQMQNSNRFRIAYVDASGVERSVQDTATLTTNEWYHYAATCDGLTLKLYRKGPSDTEYVLAGSLDVSASTNAALIDPGNDMNGQPWGWTVGRGRYGTNDDPSQNHGDRWFGGIDEVRISNVALDPSQLLAAVNAADSDNDDLPDTWEIARFGDLTSARGTEAQDPALGADWDNDDDGFDNLTEYNSSSDPLNSLSTPIDTDADGLEDEWEQFYFGNLSQTGDGDPDGDFATNEEEETAGTGPDSRADAPDQDNGGLGDGMGDSWEIHFFGDTETADDSTDYDLDGYPDIDEFLAGSSPVDEYQTPDDMDADGLQDAWEILYFNNLDQTALDDPDGDFAYNDEEAAAGTDPTDRASAPDADNGGTGDGIGDAWEIFYFGNTTTATAISDSDSDTISDLNEYLNGTDPTDDTDPFSGTNIITWATPATITDDSQILSTGTLLHAGNFRSDNTSVDVTVGSATISFENRQSQNEPGELVAGEEARVIAGSGGRQVNTGLFDATGTTVSTTFESVLDGSAWENTDPGPAPGATDMILRVTGPNGDPLVTGQEYQIQLFYSDDRPASATRGQIFHDDAIGGNQSEVMIAGDSKAVVGTFTASSSGYQDIHIQNTTGEANFPVGINAYVLRTVPADNDSDTDGMDDTWETTYFGSLSQTATGDFDGDGTDNLSEFRLGLIPNDGSSRFAVATSDNALGDGYTITWQGKAGLSFTVERSTTLEAASWTNLTPTPQAGVEGTNTFTDPAPVPAGKAFYRVLLEP